MSVFSILFLFCRLTFFPSNQRCLYQFHRPSDAPMPPLPVNTMIISMKHFILFYCKINKTEGGTLLSELLCKEKKKKEISFFFLSAGAALPSQFPISQGRSRI